MTRSRDSRKKKTSRRRSSATSPGSRSKTPHPTTWRERLPLLPGPLRQPSLEIRESLGRTIDMLQQLALRRPNSVVMVEEIVRVMVSAKRADDGSEDRP